jgi:hypothetical protein
VAGYKKRGFHYSTKQFLENTFKLEDIFHSKSIAELRNSSLYSLKEVWSIYLGRCYTVCDLPIVKYLIYDLLLKQTFDLKMDVHNYGEEYWLTFDEIPTKNNFIILNANNQDGFVSALLPLSGLNKMKQFLKL